MSAGEAEWLVTVCRGDHLKPKLREIVQQSAAVLKHSLGVLGKHSDLELNVINQDLSANSEVLDVSSKRRKVQDGADNWSKKGDGLPYTYDNGRGENANVKVRLDRAVACPEWRDLFGDAVLHHLVSSRSDHCPLFLEIRKESWERHKPRIFRYEIMWERLESLPLEIKNAWCTDANREGLGGVVAALKRVQCALRSWSKQHFGMVTKELEELRASLEEARTDPLCSNREIGSSSSSEQGRAVWKKVWSVKVPYKVNVFIWKIVNNGLPTRVNKKHRHLEQQDICQLCGSQGEDAYHAVISCPHAAAVRAAMRDHCSLPSEKDLIWSGPEWLLQIALNYCMEALTSFFLLLWHTWTIRKKIIHEGASACIGSSVIFLNRYMHSLFTIRQQGDPLDNKGKHSLIPTE
ncbi:unnamed protein product [Miscanthus lutarioriparius]|uniref:Reverse transcriptase zinc-binding domain-containing protein n=1 Tax=Miscanthus lutarioriparius TaxID=422564 RepID=A0A811R6P9_9POAL|nr:unnamed protein product [Miscanthus lutarioriparius]